MRGKKLFAVLLTLCMVMSLFAPAAGAVENGSDGIVINQNGQKDNASENNASGKENGLLISDKDIQKAPLNLKDNPLPQLAANAQNKGSWSISAFQGNLSVSLKNNGLSSNLEELKAVSSLYSHDDEVVAFVVMEGNALAETHSSRDQVKPNDEKSLLAKQNLVIRKIETDVLAGQSLAVRYQFTYLANAFSIRTAFGNLEEIANIEGVKSVFVMPTYEPMTTAAPNTAGSGEMTGVHQVWENLDYTGEGMKIAVIDTGLDLDHPSFAADPALTDESMTQEDVDNVLALLHAAQAYNGLTAEDLFRSNKIPYAFNYVDVNLTADHSKDSAGDHGTHVAGIAAANEVEGTSVVGMAPNAQIIVMKVFGANGGAYVDDYVAAIDDALTLDCDVVNLSLGSDSGFTNSGWDFIENVFANLAKQDIVATISAGNSGVSSTGNMWGTDLNRTQNMENGVVGSPSTYINAFSVASADNCQVMSQYMTTGDGEVVFYTDSYEATLHMYGYSGYENSISLLTLAGQDVEFVYIDGLNSAEDLLDSEGNSMVEGKIVVATAGDQIYYLQEMVDAVADSGAAALLIHYHREMANFYNTLMSQLTSDGRTVIPVGMLEPKYGDILAAAENKTINFSALNDVAPRPVAGGQMSSFSSWGTTSDLRLVPDITGIGGDVYSCYDKGEYGVMSGTSMSAPQVAGVSALVMQYLKDKYPELADNTGKIRELALALLMSTADPVMVGDDVVSMLEASPRQQGAGLINAWEATTSSGYLTVNGQRPKVELKDNAEGVFTFSFEVNNLSDKEQTYTLDSSLLSEAVVGGYGEFFMAGYETELSGTVAFSSESVTVPAGGSATVSVTVTLSEEDKEYFETYWANGGYVEGYIYLVSEEDVSLNLPFLGFYGDWTEAPVFDSAYWYDNDAWEIPTVDGKPSGDQYFHLPFVDFGGSDWLLGLNIYSGVMVGEDGNIVYDPANNVLSPNGDGYMDSINELYLSLLRNAKELVFTWKDGDKIVEQFYLENNSKTSYRDAYGQIVPWVATWYLDNLFEALGEMENNTQLTLSIDALIDYEGDTADNITIPVFIDLEKPSLEKVEEVAGDGSHKLVLTVAENHNLASVAVMNASGTQILNQIYDDSFVKQEDGTYLVELDITGMGTEFVVALCDYGANEGYYEVSYNSAADGNLPVMDTSLLYGYRNNDSIIYQLYGADHMYGWVSMNKPSDTEDGTVWVDTLTDDYMEYYALTAAEYAGGKVFAFDAGGNFLMMDPGLWNREVISETGLNVMDMDFDDITDTMYVLAKDGSYTSLYSIDLLTAEMTLVYEFGYYTYAPHTIAVGDDGTMYASKYNSSYLFTVVNYGDEQNPYYAMEAIYDEEYNNLVFNDHTGKAIHPQYYQSMTFLDGKIYWAYMGGDGTSSMLVIDPADGFSYTASPYATYYPDLEAAYYSDTGVSGLLSLEETEFQFPEGDTLLGLRLNNYSMNVAVGTEISLVAKATPWNYELGTVTWTSSDESVATVDENGVVTTLAPGKVTITAESDGVSAQCEMNVVHVKGSFYAYDYMMDSGLLQIDNLTMEAQIYAEPLASVVAGAYNGHDGCLYGYDYNMNFFKWDLEEGTLETLGMPSATMATDMAYDYTTGLVYAVAIDYMSGLTYIYQVNCNNGELIPYAVCPYALMAMTIDEDGTMLAVTSDGMLISLMFMEFEYEEFNQMAEIDTVYMENLGQLGYLQSMTYDWENDVILWACPEYQAIYWLDYKAAEPFVLNLGNPIPDAMELVSLFTIPENVPALPDVPVSEVNVSDMTLMSGSSALVNVEVLPLNANGYTIDMVSSDESIVSVVNGMAIGVAAGEADILVTVTDAHSSGDPIVKTIHVTVIQSADNLYGYLSGDLASGASGIWFQLPVNDTRNPMALAGTEYVIYSGEYYDGKLYAIGYNGEDYEDSSWYLMTLDPDTFEIQNKVDLGESFPFVYDMTYDYATSTMYCVAGQSESDSDLFALNLETGELVLLMQVDPMLLTLAAAADGKLYAVAMSEMSGDMWDPWAPVEYSPSILYVIDPIAGTMEEVGSTGVVMNVLSSMSYDYDTDKMYWTGLDRNTGAGGLSILDLTTGEASVIDKISSSGASVTSLYFICDQVPEEPADALYKVMMSESELMFVGSQLQLSASTLPFGADAQIAWSSSDEAVVSVDENGMASAIAAGVAEITASVTVGENNLKAVCRVAVMESDASFLTYDVTKMGWAQISRADGSVTMLTEGEELPAVIALAVAGENVYGADVEGNLFQLDLHTMERIDLGKVDSEAMIVAYYDMWGYVEGEYLVEEHEFTIRDLAYDASQDRILALGVVTQGGYELEAGASLYEVNLEDASLTQLYNFSYDVGVQGVAVDENGIVYFNSTYMDYYSSLNLETEERKDLYTIQRMGFHASSEHDHDLYFDTVTGRLYHLTTGNMAGPNGAVYSLMSLGLTQMDLDVEVGVIGEVDEDGLGDAFSGLVYVVLPELNGWVEVDGQWFYYVDNQKVIGWQQIGGLWYYFDEEGVMQTGWQQIGGKWYYMNVSGAMQTGWEQIDGQWYYLNASGAMVTGWQQIGGVWYYLNGSGIMQTGWQKIGGSWYYLNASGAMQTGWVKVDGVWYFLKDSGAMATGWLEDDGKWYYLDASGAMQTGWLHAGGVWYYMNEYGVMHTGWLQLGGNWYYLLPTSGAMVADCEMSINGVVYIFDASGVCLNP